MLLETKHVNWNKVQKSKLTFASFQGMFSTKITKTKQTKTNKYKKMYMVLIVYYYSFFILDLVLKQ